METEKLRPEEFDAHLANDTLRLSFVGMSNAGKSFRSETLRDEKDFLWYQVDGEIQRSLGLADMDAISAWLGYPSSEGYGDRERAYLELEDRFTREASMQTNGKNLVFDTTGSVAQLKPETLAALRDNTLVVHLDVGEDSLQQLMERFFQEPKPVAWGEYFSVLSGESEEDALRRSYPALLTERLRRFRQLAHVNVPTGEIFDASGEETLAIIRRHLGDI